MFFFCLIRSIYKISDNKEHSALWENIITSFLRYCSHKKYRGGFWVFKQFAREFQGLFFCIGFFAGSCVGFHLYIQHLLCREAYADFFVTDFKRCYR